MVVFDILERAIYRHDYLLMKHIYHLPVDKVIKHGDWGLKSLISDDKVFNQLFTSKQYDPLAGLLHVIYFVLPIFIC